MTQKPDEVDVDNTAQQQWEKIFPVSKWGRSINDSADYPMSYSDFKQAITEALSSLTAKHEKLQLELSVDYINQINEAKKTAAENFDACRSYEKKIGELTAKHEKEKSEMFTEIERLKEYEWKYKELCK